MLSNPDTCLRWVNLFANDFGSRALTGDEGRLALDGLGLLAYAAEMEMKSRSLGRSWNTKKPK